MAQDIVSSMVRFTGNDIDVNRGVLMGALAMTILAVLSVMAWQRLGQQVSHEESKLPLPPGSFGLPFLGESLSFIAALRANKPEQFFMSRAAKHGKVFKSSLFGWPVVNVDAPGGNRFIFANDGKLLDSFYPKSISEICGKEAFNLQPHQEHRRLRKIIMTCLSGDTLHSFAPRMEATVLAHLTEFWKGQSHVMAVASIKHFAFQVSCDIFLSLRDGPELRRFEEMYKTLTDGLMSIPVNVPGFRYYKALGARRKVLAFLDGCISRRREVMCKQPLVVKDNWRWL